MAITKVKSSNIEDLDSTKLTGTIATARLSNVDLTTLSASNLTTGTIPDARIPASAVTQHVTSTDLTAVHQAIATLGLHTAVDNNKVAHNLPNAFIDQFENSAGLATLTDVSRHENEYYLTIVPSADAGGTSGSWGAGNTSENVGGGSAMTYGTGDDLGMDSNSYNYNFISHSSGTDSTTGTAMLAGNCRSSFTGVSVNMGTTHTLLASEWYEFGLMTAVHATTTQGLTDINCDGIYIAFGGNGEDIRILQKSGTGETLISTYTTSWTSSQEISLARVGSTMYLQIGRTTVYTVPSGNFNSSAALKSVWAFSKSATARSFNDCSFRYNATSLEGISASSASATGTLVSTVQTAPAAKTEVSGVILYTDEFGTNTIGTDLEIYLTANLQGTTPNWTGTNWTEAASYGTAQTFSGTTKQVKLGKTTVTSGTAVALKGVWANQVAGVSASYETGDRTSTWTITTNAVLGGGTINNIIDGTTTIDANNNSFYFGNQSASGLYIRFQLPAQKVYTDAKWYHSGSNTYGVWKYQGSNDGSAWTDIGSTFTLGGSTLTQHTTLNGNTTPYLYYQLLGVSGSTTTAGNNIEIEFYQAASGKVAQLNGWAVNY